MLRGGGEGRVAVEVVLAGALAGPDAAVVAAVFLPVVAKVLEGAREGPATALAGVRDGLLDIARWTSGVAAREAPAEALG